MITKKNKSASIEHKRPTLLLLGLVVSFALVLESFEWLNTEPTKNELNAAVLEELPMEPPVQLIEPTPPKPVKSVAVKQSKSDEVKVVDDKTKLVNKPVVEKKKIIDLPPIVDPVDPCLDCEEDSLVIEPFILIPDVNPEFPGGIEKMYEYISDNVRTPKSLHHGGKGGKTYIQFIVEKDGSITDVQSVGGKADKNCQKEAVRVVESMPKWIPGEQNGKKVRVQFTLPFKFVVE